MFSNQHNRLAAALHRRIHAGALALGVAITTLVVPVTAAADESEFTPYHATTYGRASGDVPLPGFGLILELVGGDSAQPRLRLFGGIPGNYASILISGESDRVDDGQGNLTLIGGQPVVITGFFDGRGGFELPLEELPAGSGSGEVFFAQGTHCGVINIDPTDGPMLELSNGLSFYPAPDAETAITLGDFLPQLPENRIQAVRSALDNRDLEQTVREALNSAGDSISLKLDLKGSIGVVPTVPLGGKTQIEVAIKRTEDRRYELTIDREAAATAGVELVDGVEAEAAMGIGCQLVFQFESLPGVMYGVKGIALALMFPLLAPPQLPADGVLDGFLAAQAAAEVLQTASQQAQARLDEAKHQFFSVMRVRLDQARASYNAAHSNYLRAYSAYYGARWKTAWLLWDLTCSSVANAAAWVRYGLATAAYNVANTAVTVAETVAEAARQGVREALEHLARLGRIAWSIRQMRPFAEDHFSGTEVRFASAASLSAVIGIPGVTIQSVGAGVSGEIQVAQKVRWNQARNGQARSVITTQHIEVKGQAMAGFGIAGELTNVLGLDLEDTLTETGFGWQHTQSTAKLESNINVAGYLVTPLGVLSEQRSLGRIWSVSMPQAELLNLLGEVGYQLLIQDPVGVAASVGSAVVEFAQQDRREAGYSGKFALSAAGTGGGFGGSLIWSDQGRELKLESSIGDALGNLAKEASELIEPLANAAVGYVN